MDKPQHMLVMDMLFLVNTTLKNDINTQKREAHCSCLLPREIGDVIVDITHKDPYIHNFTLDMV